MRVFVSGGTGFVGTVLTAVLLDRGHSVTLLCHERRPPPQPRLSVVEGDVRVEGAWTSALAGHDAAVHLVAVIREWVSRGITFEALHVGATHRMLVAARRAGVRRFVHMSALGVGRCDQARYMQTKGRAEAEVMGSDVDATILRPSFIFGEGSPFFRMMAELGRAPVTPVVGRGDVAFQPVALADVALAIARCLERQASIGRTYEMGGPDVVTYRQLLDLMAPRPVRALHLPTAVVRSVAAVMEALPSFPLTVDQIALLGCPNVARDRRWEADLGIEAASFRAWARTYAGRGALSS
jgi:uncharacterized protein YbjT (DUF2867 family)